jgi:C1A family cysteine protease
MYSRKIMSIIVINTMFFACAGHASEPLSVDQQFQLFQEKYHKVYASPSLAEYRKKVFADNLAKIQKQNAEHHSYQLGINEFADQTWEEFSATHLMKPGWQLQFSKQFGGKKFQPSKVTPVLYDVDWRSKGAVTSVKNQGQCGSGWAFATTGLIEGAAQIQGGGVLHDLSEQEFLDCNTSNAACFGGQIDKALSFAMDGVTTEADYPYTARPGTCRTFTPIVQVTSYSEVTPNDEAALTAAVNEQPIAVGVQADPAIFQFYRSGVITTSANCGAVLNHALLVVGYGSSSVPYWIVKNSWGTSWGASGYVFIQRGTNVNGGAGVCGIAAYPWAAHAS